MTHHVLSAAGSKRVKDKLAALPSYTTGSERTRQHMQFLEDELRAEGCTGPFQKLGADGQFHGDARGEMRFDSFTANIEDHMHRRNDAAASLPATGFAESDTLSPAQREGVANYLGALYGEGADGTNSKVNLLSKSDLYLIVRYNSAIQHAKRTATADARAAERGQDKDKAAALSDAKAEGGHRGDAAGVRFDAASNERAYRAAAADLNSWRDRQDSAAGHQPQDHGGLPHRADAHVLQPVRRDSAQGGTREDEAAAYRRSVNDINAWRDE